jgi:hypothetical protein
MYMPMPTAGSSPGGGQRPGFYAQPVGPYGMPLSPGGMPAMPMQHQGGHDGPPGNGERRRLRAGGGVGWGRGGSCLAWRGALALQLVHASAHVAAPPRGADVRADAACLRDPRACRRAHGRPRWRRAWQGRRARQRRQLLRWGAPCGG